MHLIEKGKLFQIKEIEDSQNLERKTILDRFLVNKQLCFWFTVKPLGAQLPLCLVLPDGDGDDVTVRGEKNSRGNCRRG